ncbi:MAG: hypothetical protein U0Q16_35440 [Bryobacteraceae bacterium]
MPNVAVNRASRISATRWAKLIQESPGVPDFVKQGIKVQGNVIQGPGTIKQPSGRIPKDWIDDLAAAFASEAWEITTAEETFEVEAGKGEAVVRRRVVPDLGQGESGPGYWMTVGPGQREWSPDTRYIHSTYKVGDIALLYGETYSSATVNRQAKKDEATPETRLTSGRALIIIVDRVTVYGVKSFSSLAERFMPALLLDFGLPEEIPISAKSLVYSFLHELAAHAGRMNQGKTAVHGAPLVEESVNDIKALFDEDPEGIHMPRTAAAVRSAAERLASLAKKPAARAGKR